MKQVWMNASRRAMVSRAARVMPLPMWALVVTSHTLVDSALCKACCVPVPVRVVVPVPDSGATNWEFAAFLQLAVCAVANSPADGGDVVVPLWRPKEVDRNAVAAVVSACLKKKWICKGVAEWSQLQPMPEIDYDTSAPSTVAKGKLRVNVDIRPVDDSRCVTVCHVPAAVPPSPLTMVPEPPQLPCYFARHAAPSKCRAGQGPPSS